MGIRTQRYLFGRLNVVATYENKKDFLLKAFQESQIFTKKVNNYGFYNVRNYSLSGVDYISGYLVKYRPYMDYERAQPNIKELKEEHLANFVRAKSRFLMHVKSGITAFHPVTNEIADTDFIHLLAKMITDFYQDFFINIDFSMIEEDAQLIKQLKSLDSIERIIIRLHPSNPSNREIWKKHDQRFKKLGIKSSTEQILISAVPEQITDDDELNSKLIMADDGYGKAKIMGRKNGSKKIISTSDMPVSEEGPTDESGINSLWESLQETFTKLFDRFNND